MYKIAALYHFTPLTGLPELREKLRAFCKMQDICGTLLLAAEGINGTIAGSEISIAAVLEMLTRDFGLPADNAKFAFAEDKPFKRLKIRLKREIITFRNKNSDPIQHKTGTYVAPEKWNDILNDPEMVVIDTRNSYEVALGSFHGARDPGIKHFSQFAEYVREELDPAQHKKVAMFCTGGIRCEKASAFMLSEGFQEVYHLKGGILKYLEQIPRDQSKWQGACFVFDERVAVAHGPERLNNLRWSPNTSSSEMTLEKFRCCRYDGCKF